MALQKQLFWDGLHIKFTGDCGLVSPPFIAKRSDIDAIVDILRKALKAL